MKKKSWLKKLVENKKAFWSVVGTLIFLAVGLAIFLIGAYASGWNVLAVLFTPNAYFWYFVIFLILLPSIVFLLICYITIYKDDKNGR